MATAPKFKEPKFAGPAESGAVRVIETGAPDYLAMVRATMSDEKAAELSRFASQMPPGASADAVIAAFRSQVPPDSSVADGVVSAVDGRIAAKTTANTALLGSEEPEDDTTGFGNEVYEGFKGVARTALNVLSLPGDIMKAQVEGLIGDATDRTDVTAAERVIESVTPLQAWKSTSLYNQLTNWSDQGSGYFNGEGAGEAQEAQRTRLLYREVQVTDPDTGQTTTKKVASNFGMETAGAVSTSVGFGQGTDVYKWSTGITDFVAAVALDPTTYLTMGALGVGKAAKMAKYTEAQAEMAGRTRSALKSGAIRDLLDLDEGARASLKTALEQEEAAFKATAAAERTPEMVADADRSMKILRAIKLKEAAEKKATRDRWVRERLDARLDRVVEEVKSGTLSMDEQVNRIEQAMKDALDDRMKDLDENFIPSLYEAHREAASLVDEAMNPGRAKISRGIEEALDQARGGLKPRPGPAARRADAIADRFTSNEEIAAAAARREEAAARGAAERAKAAEAALEKARRSFGVIATRRRVAEAAGDAATVKALDADEGRLLSQMWSSLGPTDNVKDQVGRLRALNDATSEVYKKWYKEGVEAAQRNADEAGVDAALAPLARDEALKGIEDDVLKQAEERLGQVDGQAAALDKNMSGAAKDAVEAHDAGLRASQRLWGDEVGREMRDIDRMIPKLRRNLEQTRKAREADAAAAARKARAAEAQLSKSADKLTEKVNLLRTVYGLHDEVGKLLNGDTAPLAGVLKESMGLSEFTGVDWARFSSALFGSKAGQASVSLLAAETSPTRIWRAMGRKVDIQVARDIAKAGTEQEVLDVLARAVGARKGITGPIDGFGMRAYRASVPKDTTMFARSVAGVGDWSFRTYSASQRVVPWAHDLHLEDAQSVQLAMDDWINMAVGPRGRGRLGRAEARVLIDSVLDEIAKADDMFARRDAVQKGLKRAASEMAAASGLDEKSAFFKSLDEAFNKAFQTSKRSKGGTSDFLTVSAAMDPAGTGKAINGVNLLDERVPRHIYQLSEFFRLPDVREVQTIIKQGKKFTGDSSRLKGELNDFLEYKIDKMFRVGVLVFRPAYVLRNLGEAAFRQFLHGSLHDPMTLAGMAMRHSKDRRFLARFDAYSHDVLGREFLARAKDDAFGDLGVLDEEMRGVLWRTHSVLDPGFQKKLGSTGQGITLAPHQPNFVKAWKHQLATLRGDKVTVDVVAAMKNLPTRRISEYAAAIGEPDNMRAVLRYYSEGPGKAVFERMAAERPGHWGRMLDASGRTKDDDIIAALKSGRWTIDQQALEQVLFTHNGSFLNEARKFLADMDPDLTAAWLGGKTYSGPPLDSLVKKMHSTSQDSLPPYVWWSGTKAAGNAADDSGFITRQVDRFFHWSAITEGAINYAPETRWAYWQKVEDLFPYLTRYDQEELLKVAEQSLKPLRVGGKAVGVTKQGRLAKRLGETAKDGKAGLLTREDVHALAAQHAVRDTKELLYDGFARKQYWYATRLVFPFGQAWQNTLSKWAQLAATPKGAVRVLALKKGYQSLSGGYEHSTQEEWEVKKQQLLNDPASRPILYQDPQTGQMVMDVPIVGDILKMFGGPASDTVMPIASLNVATGGGGLPGLGPVVTLPAKTMFNLTDMEDITPDWVEKWIEPFPSGLKDGPTRMAYESFTGAWMRRIAAAIDPDFGDQEIQAMTPQLMTYLATSHRDRYLNEAGVFTEEGKVLLAEDTRRLARQTSLYRGVSQAILPGTALFRWMQETEDGTDVMQAAAWLDFQKMLDENGQEFGPAIQEFEDTYGPGSLLTVLGKYDGDYSPTTKAAEYFKEHPSDLTAFPTVAGLFFPYDGTYSPAFDQTLRARDLRTKRTPDEMMDRANQSRYYNILAWYQEKVDSGQIDEDYMKSEMSRLADEFGVANNLALVNDRGAKIREIKAALNSDSSLKDTEAGQAAATYMGLRDEAMARIEASGVATSFKDKDAAAIRQWMYAQGTALAKQYPDFARMWQNVFESEVAG